MERRLAARTKEAQDLRDKYNGIERQAREAMAQADRERATRIKMEKDLRVAEEERDKAERSSVKHLTEIAVSALL